VRLLLDSSVWGLAMVKLRAAGHDAEWVGDWPRDPGDDAILAIAHREQRILITLDKDFGELAVRKGATHSGIVRLVRVPVEDQARVCLQVLRDHGQDLLDGAIVTAGPRRLRLRPPNGAAP
jgi:predicted nuclease of predicted toxin-antitoxin system